MPLLVSLSLRFHKSFWTKRVTFRQICLLSNQADCIIGIFTSLSSYILPGPRSDCGRVCQTGGVAGGGFSQLSFNTKFISDWSSSGETDFSGEKLQFCTVQCYCTFPSNAAAALIAILNSSLIMTASIFRSFRKKCTKLQQQFCDCNLCRISPRVAQQLQHCAVK